MIIQDVFNENLKYISETQIDVKLITQQFNGMDKMIVHNLGVTNFPTGRIITADPLCYLASNEYCPELDKEISPGQYPIDIAIFKNDYELRMCTLRLKIKDTLPISYEQAQPTLKTTVLVAEDGILAGFPVDAGMVTICDVATAEKYREFINEWKHHNPDKDYYEDYFAKRFAKSQTKFPDRQRSDGDFILWRDLPMVASGFGDGFYNAYWGYDDNGEICELIIPMVNPELFPEKIDRPVNYAFIAEKAVEDAKQGGITLDYSIESIRDVDTILEYYYQNQGEQDEDELCGIAIRYGVYVGQVLLNTILLDKGFTWDFEKAYPELKRGEIYIGIVYKAQKRIYYGNNESIHNCCKVIGQIINKDISVPQRVINIELGDNGIEENVPLWEVDSYIGQVEQGAEPHAILNSNDGFLQFYGTDNQFVAEIIIEEHGERVYEIISNTNKDTNSKTLNTEFGRYKVEANQILTKSELQSVITNYYKCLTKNELLSVVSYK